MKNKFKELLYLTREAKAQGVRMQHKLLLYWISMMLAVFGSLLVILSFAGVFSDAEDELHQILSVQHSSSVREIMEQLDLLSAQSVAISEQASYAFQNLLYDEPTSSLNNQSDQILRLESALYRSLYTALRSSPCSEAYFVMDATTNTKAKGAEDFRAGVYIRFTNLNGKSAVSQDIIYYRGVPAIARENNLELHNRWRLEFDSSLINGYEEMLVRESSKMRDSCIWTGRVPLTDTWEHINLLMVPIPGTDGRARGICGVGVSDLHFQLYYPAQESTFGNMVTILAPMNDGALVLSEGMVGGSEGTYLNESDILLVEQDSSFNTYRSKSEAYFGIHSRIDMKNVSGDPMHVVTLVPEDSYNSISMSKRMQWVIGSLIFLFAMLGLSVFLSRRFVKPISESLEAIQSNSSLEKEKSGISEIDAVLNFFRGKWNHIGKSSLPPDMEELLSTFSERASKLTATERSILKYYADGKEVSEVAELAFISIHTVRKHNANIYQKLGIGSRDELMLYIELFRRCGRLDEILNNPGNINM